jgi:hypothetical protein
MKTSATAEQGIRRCLRLRRMVLKPAISSIEKQMEEMARQIA